MIPQKPLALGAWSKQGRPFYGGGVSYVKSFEIAAPAAGGDRYFVKLENWLGSVAEVRVGDRTAGYVAFPPHEIDITDLLNPGRNTVSVTVFGTLKNTLGPHHNSPVLGTAWPGMFQKGAAGGYPPGSGYSVLGYGLFEDFRLLRAAAK